MATEADETTFDADSDPYILTPDAIQEPPATFRGRLKFLGPGMITSAAVVGSGELLTATTLGATGFVKSLSFTDGGATAMEFFDPSTIKNELGDLSTTVIGALGTGTIGQTTAASTAFT